MMCHFRQFFALSALTIACALAHADEVPPAVSAGIAAKQIVRGDLQGLQMTDLRSQRR